MLVWNPLLTLSHTDSATVVLKKTPCLCLFSQTPNRASIMLLCGCFQTVLVLQTCRCGMLHGSIGESHGYFAKPALFCTNTLTLPYEYHHLGFELPTSRWSRGECVFFCVVFPPFLSFLSLLLIISEGKAPPAVLLTHLFSITLSSHASKEPAGPLWAAWLSNFDANNLPEVALSLHQSLAQTLKSILGSCSHKQYLPSCHWFCCSILLIFISLPVSLHQQTTRYQQVHQWKHKNSHTTTQLSYAIVHSPFPFTKKRKQKNYSPSLAFKCYPEIFGIWK